MTRRLVMGTAGHIDHGKTSLIKLLTGYDCDRLPEEKARGITIELGFTHLTLPSGVTVGVVDVPGHERFVRTMVAGAAGIDFVLLVIAADEAVMPQTREHLAICRLLGIPRGLVALTKSDLVDDDMLALAREDVTALVADTFLAGAPIVPVSNTTGAGQAELLAAIDEVARAASDRPDSGIFRLPVDRVFTMRGFGTIVTGTAVGGRVAVGDELEMLPQGRVTRVRTLQVHGASVTEAAAGQRTAINLHGLAVEDVPRGALLAAPGVLAPTHLLDVELALESDAPRPITNRSRVRLHLFTREVPARVVPLDTAQIEPGGRGLAQLRLAAPVVALPGDRFVLRSYSPPATVGGGVVLHAQPAKHRRPFTVAVDDLRALQTGDLLRQIEIHFRQAGRRGLDPARLAALLGVGAKPLREALALLLSRRRIVRVDKETDLAVDAEALSALQAELVRLLGDFHRQRPTEAGLSRAELQDRAAKGAEPKVLQRALQELLNAGQIAFDGATARLATHRAAAGDELQKTVDRVAALVREAGLSAPTQRELAEAVGDPKAAEQALALLAREGRVVRVGETLYFDREALARAERALIDYLNQHREIDAQGMKTLFGISRKWSIPLAEHFDAARLTLRVGDKRVLRRRD